MFKWIWGEKPVNHPIKFESKPKQINYNERKIRIHMELSIDTPDYCEIVEVMKESKMQFELPFEAKLKGVSISHIEVLN